MELLIQVIDNFKALPEEEFNTLFLIKDNWDDWGVYNNKYYAIFFENNGSMVELGYLKIGCPQIELVQKRPKLPNKTNNLPLNYYSLGQAEDYYKNIMKLGKSEAFSILDKLRDVVFNKDLYITHHLDPAMTDSLQRYVSTSTINGQFSNIINGSNRLDGFDFSYNKTDESCTKINFSVQTNSTPPTNIHVIIGSNGVGKTTILNEICNELTKKNDPSRLIMSNHDIANVVAMSFGVFEKFSPISIKNLSQNAITYSYIGSKKIIIRNNEEIITSKSADDFFQEFIDSLKACHYEPRKSFLKKSIEYLNFDPILNELGIEDILDSNADSTELRKIFDSLSSGHKIVILSITKLIEVIEEKTLLLIDEPETHLHPPLLSALVRLFSQLLKDCNGLAIIATHSSVVLQETPKQCVTVLTRSGVKLEASRPEIETFGENISILTRSVFNLELSRTGYVKLITDKIKEKKYFNSVYEEFNGELGGEALAILSALSEDDRSY